MAGSTGWERRQARREQQFADEVKHGVYEAAKLPESRRVILAQDAARELRRDLGRQPTTAESVAVHWFLDEIEVGVARGVLTEAEAAEAMRLKDRMRRREWPPGRWTR